MHPHLPGRCPAFTGRFVLHAALQVLYGGLIRLKDAGLGPHLDGHIGYRHPLRNAHPRCGLALELAGQVVGAISPDVANNAQHRVLGCDVLGQPSLDHELQGLGHHEPELPRGKDGCHVRGSDSCGKGPEGSVGAGVRVRAHDYAAGKHMALLRHDLVAYAAENVVVEDALLCGELAQHDMIFRRLQAVCRHLMIEEKHDLGGIPDLGVLTCDLIEPLDRQGTGDIVNHGSVYLRHDELARTHLFICRSGKYLLRQGLATHGRIHFIHDK